MALQALAKDIWVVETFLENLPAVKFPVRMTVIKLKSQDLMLISPISPTPEIVSSLRSLGEVKHIVAPNCMHHLFVNDFAKNFPGAQIWGPKDLHDKRKDIAFTGTLEATPAMPWSSEVEMVSVMARPPAFEEIIFFHKSSKTVIITDLLFNIQNFHGILEKLLFRLNGAYKKLVMTRLGRQFFKDRKSLHLAASRILSWNPDNLIVAHGEIIRGEAAVALRSPLAEYTSISS